MGSRDLPKRIAGRIEEGNRAVGRTEKDTGRTKVQSGQLTEVFGQSEIFGQEREILVLRNFCISGNCGLSHPDIFLIKFSVTVVNSKSGI